MEIMPFYEAAKSTAIFNEAVYQKIKTQTLTSTSTYLSQRN